MSGLLCPEQDLHDSEGHSHQRRGRLCLAPSYFSLPFLDKILYEVSLNSSCQKPRLPFLMSPEGDSRETDG